MIKYFEGLWFLQTINQGMRKKLLLSDWRDVCGLQVTGICMSIPLSSGASAKSVMIFRDSAAYLLYHKCICSRWGRFAAFCPTQIFIWRLENVKYTSVYACGKSWFMATWRAALFMGVCTPMGPRRRDAGSALNALRLHFNSVLT